jgi:hypothetical protein
MSRFCSVLTLVCMGVVMILPHFAHAAPYAEGPKKCQECHEAEYEVWQNSQHAKAYKAFHKRKDAKRIVKAVGGSKSVKKNANCALCHYTRVQKKASGKARAKAGPSCESCHGASSDWRSVHNDFGGSDDPKKETKANRTKRHAAARKSGMIWSFMRYDIASKCMDCHGLANPKLKADVLAKMLDAGHPLKPEFEVVRYSQGSVLHRFYPPDVTSNKPLDKAGLSRLFVEGQMAKLVSASRAASKSKHPKYAAAQKRRAADARAALAKVKSVPAINKFLSKPNDASARAVEAAISNKDLSGEVGGLLPASSSYK